MPIVDYTPHPAGGYVFQTDTGNPVHIIGPEGDAMAQHIDLQKGAAAPMIPEGSQLVPIAPNDPRFRELPPSQGGDPEEFAASQAAHGVPQPQPEGAAPAAVPVAPGQPQPAVPGQPQPTDNPALARLNDIATNGVRVPGSPGVSQKQLEARAGQGVPIQTAMTVSGGLNETPEQKAQREEQEKKNDERRMALQADIDAAQSEKVKAAQENETAALNDVMRTRVEQGQAQEKLQLAQKAFDQQQAKVQGELDAADKLTIDPKRLWKTQGVGANIASVLGIFLGGLGTRNGGENTALKIVQANIDRDIAAQTDEIEAKRAHANNAVANIMKTHGLPLDEAKLLAKETGLRYTAALANAQAARMGTPQAKAEAAQMQMAAMNQAEQYAAQRAELTRGRATMQYQMQYPHGPTSGGVRPATIGELGSIANATTSALKAQNAGRGAPGEDKSKQIAADADEYMQIQQKLQKIGVPHTQAEQREHDALVAQARPLRVRMAGQQARTAFGGEGGQKALAIASGESSGMFGNVLGGYDAQLKQNIQWAEQQKEQAAAAGGGTVAGPAPKEEPVPGAEDVGEEE